MDECARRNPYETCYRWDTPYSPVDERLRHARFCEKQYRKNLDGKPLTQRDFAKLIDYPINRYVEAERIDRYGRGDEESPVDDELLEKLIMIAHANPYWLYDSECYAEYAEYDSDNEAVLYGDAPTVYAKPDVILKWIKEDKPRFTRWEDYRIS